MTEFQYIYITSALKEFKAEGIEVPIWNSGSWVKVRDLTGRVHMTYVGDSYIISINVPPRTDGTETVKFGRVSWVDTESEEI
jgi:hypothetical protein